MVGRWNVRMPSQRLLFGAFASLVLLLAVPGAAAQGPHALAPTPPDGLFTCRWSDDGLGLYAPESQGDLFAGHRGDGSALVLVDLGASSASADACPGQDARPCGLPLPAGFAFTQATGLLCFDPDGAARPADPVSPATVECPLDRLLSDSNAAAVPCLDGLSLPCDNYRDCVPSVPDPDDLCGGVDNGVHTAAADIPCVGPVNPPGNPCQPASACVPDPDELCGGVDNGAETMAYTIPCVGTIEPPCSPASECVPPTCPTLSSVPGLCGHPLPSTNVCDYLNGLNGASDTNLPCGGTLDECDYLGSVPGFCGKPLPPTCPTLSSVPGLCGHPLPSTNVCDYVGGFFPSASDTNLPCGGSVDECDYAGAVPGLCGHPLPSTNPCDYVGGLIGSVSYLALPCGGSVEECDYLGNVPGLCGKPLPPTDPCYYLGGLIGSLSNTNLPCGGTLDECDYLGNVPGFCGKPLPPTDPCYYVNGVAPSENLALVNLCGRDVEECPTLAAVPGQCGSPGPTDCSRIPQAVPALCDHPVPDACATLAALLQSTSASMSLSGPCGIELKDVCEYAPDTLFLCRPPPPPPPPCKEGYGIEGTLCVLEDGVPCVQYKATPDEQCPQPRILYALLAFLRGKGGIVGVIRDIEDDLDDDGLGDEWERRVAGTLTAIEDKLLDLDSDGLKNVDEFRWNTNPFDPDSDDDGLTDGPEAAYWDDTPDPMVSLSGGLAIQDADSKTDTDSDGTPNILDPDSDGDHLLDGEEYYGTYSGGVQTYLEYVDSETNGAGDGLTDYQEVRDTDNDPSNGVDTGYHTLPMVTYSDADGVADGDEAARWGSDWNTAYDCSDGSNNLRDADSDGDTLTDGDEWDQYATSPASVDSDGDVMDDGFEVAKGLQPTSALDGATDVDGDGLASQFEYVFEQPPGYQVCQFGPFFGGLDPLNADMDGDGIGDGGELLGSGNGYSTAYYPFLPGSTDAKHDDSDWDGLNDPSEINVFRTDPNNQDTDGDGLDDQTEVAWTHTSPTNPDSDGDGMPDGQEVYQGIDPTNPDSDGDGAADGSDSNPREEEIAPAYPASGPTYRVFREDGYIDLFIDDVNDQETDLLAVQVFGKLQATDTAGAAISYPLHLNAEAKRGDNGVWGARFAIPPGVRDVTHEDLEVVVTDQSGHTWGSSGSFSNVLHSPQWDTAPSQVRSAGDWHTLIGNQPPADSQAPSQSSAALGLPAIVTDGQGTPWAQFGEQAPIVVYRLETSAFPPMSYEHGPLGVSVLQDAFTLVDPVKDLGVYQQASFGFHFNFGELWDGVTNGLKSAMDTSIDWGETALRVAKEESASFLFGSDGPGANGAMLGDIVGGFLAWGNLRDCLIRPFFQPDDTSAAEDLINAALTALSCEALLVNIGEVTPVAPEAVGAEGVMQVIKQVLKMLLHSEVRLGVYFVDYMKACVHDLTLCKSIGLLGKFAIDEPAAQKGLRGLIDALGEERVVALKGVDNGLAEQASRMGSDFEAVGRTGQFRGVMQQADRPLAGWTREQTLKGVSDMYERAKATDPSRAVQYAEDLALFLSKADSKIPAADVRSFLEQGLIETDNAAQGAARMNDGNFLEAQVAREHLNADHQVSAFAEKYTGQKAYTYQGGKRTGEITVAGEMDLVVDTGAGRVRVEVKDSPFSDDHMNQLRKQLGFTKYHSGDFAQKHVLELGKGLHDPSMLAKIESEAKNYGIEVTVRDRTTGQVFVYGP